MKDFNLNIVYLAIFVMIFASCSKEETGVGLEAEKATLSFGAVISDLVGNREASKQSIGEMPECSDDEPAYVRIVLLDGDTEIVGTTAEPYRVNLVPGEIFTSEDPRLELEAGIYTLSHFSVYNEDDQLLWLAPRDGALANFVDVTLPIDIDLRAGAKKYVDVTVLCYDNRNVNQYGYLFLELNTFEVVEFCFFANYCNEDGKHFSARYSLDLWKGTDATGDQIYDGLENTVGTNEDGDFFASALCVAVPVNEDLNEDYLYYRLTLLDWEGNYGDITETVISGTLSRADIEANFGDGNEIEYEHLRFGCGDDDEEPAPDADGDGVPDSTDECDNEEGPASNNGCPVTETDTDGDGVPDSTDECDDVDGPASNNGCPEETDTDGDGVPDSTDECDNEEGPASNNGCPVATDTDGDGVPDSTDECDNEEGPASNNGCPVETCDQTNPTADCDNDGTDNECDEDSINYATFDCDSDGVLNGVDTCPETIVTSGQVDLDGDGCWTDPDTGTTCTIEAPSAGCFSANLQGNSGFVQIVDPGAEPEFYSLLDQDGVPIAQVTILVAEGETVFLVNAAFGVVLDDYLIEISQSSTGSDSVCYSDEDITVNIGADEPDFVVNAATVFSYPFYVRMSANYCTTE